MLVSNFRPRDKRKRLEPGRFHPDFCDPNSKIQRDMLECMRLWVDGLGSSQQSILRRLSKEAVRNHQNVRDAGQDGPGPSGGSFVTTEAHSHSVKQQFLPLLNKDNNSSQYVTITTANTGEPTSNYASTTAEAKYTPRYQDYAAESSSPYTSKPAPSHGYRPPSPYRPHGTSNETSGYAPSYTPSLPGPPPGPPAGPAYPGFSGADPAQYGRHHHYGHEAGHESWHDDQPEGHHKRREDLHDHSYHHHHHHESSGYTPGGFSEPVPGGPVPETPFSFPNSQPYQGQTPQEPRFANLPQSDDPNQYGWRY